MYFPVLDTAITEISLSWPLRNYWVLLIMCLTTIVVPSGKIRCSLSGCKIRPWFTLPAHAHSSSESLPRQPLTFEADDSGEVEIS